jgi:taurine dioxygenase
LVTFPSVDFIPEAERQQGVESEYPAPMAEMQAIDPHSSLNIRPLTGVIGAEISGLDLTTMDDSKVAALRSAVCRHEVVVVRNQNIDAVQQSQFSRRLGPVGEVPFVATRPDAPDVIRVVKEADEGGAFNFGGAWHSDFSFQSEPPSFTLLAAVDVPPWGGDTVFASMSAAWDALPAATKERLVSLQAVHSARDAYSRRMQPLHSGMRGMTIICDDSANSEQRHPLVCQHPETGKTVLFFNRAYVRDIDGLEQDEATTLMDFLHQHTTDARFTYRHRWLSGDVVIWDNRSTQHFALNDYAGFRRELNRTTVAGSIPLAAAVSQSL